MQYSVYHPNFRKRRKECLKKAGNVCQRCGIANRSITFSMDFEWYICYLHAAHVFTDQKEDPDAPLIALCPSCHWKFDHPSTESDFFFLGRVVQEFIEASAQEAAP